MATCEILTAVVDNVAPPPHVCFTCSPLRSFLPSRYPPVMSAVPLQLDESWTSGGSGNSMSIPQFGGGGAGKWDQFAANEKCDAVIDGRTEL